MTAHQASMPPWVRSPTQTLPASLTDVLCISAKLLCFRVPDSACQPGIGCGRRPPALVSPRLTASVCSDSTGTKNCRAAECLLQVPKTLPRSPSSPQSQTRIRPTEPPFRLRTCTRCSLSALCTLADEPHRVLLALRNAKGSAFLAEAALPKLQKRAWQTRLLTRIAGSRGPHARQEAGDVRKRVGEVDC